MLTLEPRSPLIEDKIEKLLPRTGSPPGPFWTGCTAAICGEQPGWHCSGPSRAASLGCGGSRCSEWPGDGAGGRRISAVKKRVDSSVLPTKCACQVGMGMAVGLQVDLRPGLKQACLQIWQSWRCGWGWGEPALGYYSYPGPTPSEYWWAHVDSLQWEHEADTQHLVWCIGPEQLLIFSTGA